MRNGSAVPPEQQPLAKVLGSGQDVFGYEAQIERTDGSSVDVMMSATPLFDEAGKIRGAIVALVDISRHKEAERHQETLLHELQHRVKNILATVTALTARMMRSSISVEEFSSAFLQRLQAMARTHELLSGNSWEGADLERLIERTVSPYAASDRQNVRFEGTAVQLKPNAAATCGLIFFELASNAAKYGALSKEKGRVEVSWRVNEPEGRLSIRWKEVAGRQWRIAQKGISEPRLFSRV